MANPAEAGKLSMPTIGERLREAREKKAVTIDQAQKQTHIHSTVLAALEEGRCDDMLAPNYVKSFLREYSNYLGLNSGELLSAYIALHPESNRPNLNLNRMEPKSAARRPNFLGSLKKILIVALILFVAVFLVKKAVIIFKSPKFTKSGAVSGAVKPSAKKSASKVDIAIKEIPKSIPLTLVIRIKRPVMLQLKKDGVILFKRFMQKGAVESLTANDRISISVAKAEAIELILNGKNLGSPGKGVIKNLEITRTGLRIR
ncbi:MAG: DUF4115 domain-containing protein [Candidatus Omnitrophota bacterium]|nr:DUF4115 domain-containing protein [Candidatus Omnitrophota bacterium]